VTTTLLLVRHAATTMVGRVLAGRMPWVPLSPHGRQQAERLAEYLTPFAAIAVYASPLERAQGTADPIARRFGLPIQTDDGLHEIDYGDWTGQNLDDLARLERWRHFNTFRSGTRIPNGESMLEAQSRIVAALDRLAGKHAGKAVVVVSHADMIRAALAHWLGMPLDLMLRLEVDPASVSVVDVEPWGPRVRRLNDTGAAP